MEKFTNRMDLRNDRISGLESNIQELKHSVNYKDKLIKKYMKETSEIYRAPQKT